MKYFHTVLLLFAIQIYSLCKVNASNQFQINDVEVTPGEIFILPISISNDECLLGFQFEMTLPQGISVLTDTIYDNKLNRTIVPIQFSKRKAEGAVMGGVVEDNKLKVIAYSPKAKEFWGANGEIAYIAFNVSDDYCGSNSIVINNIVMSLTDEKKHCYTRSQDAFTVDLLFRPSTEPQGDEQTEVRAESRYYNIQGMCISKGTTSKFVVSRNKKYSK